jgi:hypothetical protein
MIMIGCSSTPSNKTISENNIPKITFEYPIDSYKFNFNGRHIIVNTIINDSIEGSFLFDLGAQTPLFDSAFVESNKTKLGVNIRYVNRKVTTPGGLIKINQEIQGKMKFSALGMEQEFDGRFNVGNLNNTRLNVDAIFPPYWFFNENIILMDIEHQYFQIIQKESIDSIKKQFTSFPLKGNPVTCFTISTEIDITSNCEFKTSGELVLDTGAPEFLYLCPSNPLIGNKNIVQIDIPEELNVYKAKRLGIDPNKMLIEKIIFANQITMFDTLRFQNEQVRLLDFRIAPEHIGFLGNDFFRKFIVIFDFINMEFYIKPNESYSLPHNPFSLGLKLYRTADLNLYVNSIYESSNAAKIGLQTGDKILRINGESTIDITNEKINSIEYSNPGTKIAFEVQRGHDKINYEFYTDSIN